MRQTNKYARENIVSLRERGRLPLNSRFKTWPEDGMTAGDIKTFLADRRHEPCESGEYSGLLVHA